MAKKNEYKPKKVIMTFEVEESPTKCCECVFGAGCPYDELPKGLDCAKYNLSTMKMVKISEINND